MEGRNYDVVIIGAGAAGLMAAGVAARAGHSVLVAEKMEKAARKVRITGKGRCNLTNIKPREDFLAKVRANADFFAPAFDGFDNQAVVDFFRSEGVAITVERGGRVFPKSGKAWDIADALVDWATEGGAEISYHTRVTDIEVVNGKVSGVNMFTRRGFQRKIECRKVILCTGGASYPATGSTGEGYHMAHDLGHRIEDVRPSLVPLESDSDMVRELEGVALKNVAVKLLADTEIIAEEFGEMSFTKRGLEGAVILRISRIAVDAIIAEKDVKIQIDLKSALDTDTIRARIVRELAEMEPEADLSELLRKLMPKPMIAPFARYVSLLARTPAARMTEEETEKVVTALKCIEIPVTDYRSFEEAVVTAGGVAVEDVDLLTMQSKLIAGLYFAGEILDIDADTGGYNLQVAFSTGYLAGQLK